MKMLKSELGRLWHAYFNAAGIATNYAGPQDYIILQEFGSACIFAPEGWPVTNEEIIKAAKDTGCSKIFVLHGPPNVQTYPAYVVHLSGMPIDNGSCACKYADKKPPVDKDCCCKSFSWVLSRCRGEYGRMWGDFGEGPEEYADLTNYPKDTARGVANGLTAVRNALRQGIASTEKELEEKRCYVDSIDDRVEAYRRWDAAPYPK
jgi:hypothetical protein